MKPTVEPSRVSTGARSPTALDRALWYGLLGGPAAGFLDVTASNMIVEGGAPRWWIYVVSAVTLAMILFAGLCAFAGVVHAPAQPEHRRARVEFMGRAGLLVSAFAFVVALAFLVPKIVHRGDVAI